MSLDEARELLDAGDYPAAGQLLTQMLRNDPDSPEVMFMYGRAMLEVDKPQVARVFYERLSQNGGKSRWQVWLNLGKCYDDLHMHDRAQGCYRKVLKMTTDTKAVHCATRNMGSSNVQQGNWKQAEEWALKALSMEDERQSHIDLAYCYLSTGRYGEGWDEYSHGIGSQQWRNRKSYAGEPQWSGERGRVIVTGEQGVGDQIAYMSCLHDAQKLTDIAAIDCYPKLRNLFARTFADVPVYGDMFKTEVDWDPSPNFTHSALMSLLPRYTRRNGEFPGTGYLKPCPIRTAQWKATFKRPTVGIAWTGGIEKTARRQRSTTFETFEPLTRCGVDVVSLEYKSPGDIPIPHYPWATETDDYDDTAALVAALDLVICVPTSVAHLAGALGVPCWMILHDNPHFLCRMPLWNSVKTYQRKSGSWAVIEQVAADLKEWQSERKAA